MPDTFLMEKVIGLIARSGKGRSSSAVASLVASQSIREEGVAAMVFDEVLYREGRATGHLVSMDQARAMANQQLQLVRSDPASAATAGEVPAGTDPAVYFLSPRVIAGYQRAMTIGLERHTVLASFPTAGLEAGVDHWFADALTRHSVTINGAPPRFSLVQAFAAGRFVGA